MIVAISHWPTRWKSLTLRTNEVMKAIFRGKVFALFSSSTKRTFKCTVAVIYILPSLPPSLFDRMRFQKYSRNSLAAAYRPASNLGSFDSNFNLICMKSRCMRRTPCEGHPHRTSRVRIQQASRGIRQGHSHGPSYAN